MRARGAATALAMALAQPPPPSPTPPSRWMRCEAASSSMPSSSSSVGGGFGDLLPSRDGRSSLRLSPPQRSWVVRTELTTTDEQFGSPEKIMKGLNRMQLFGVQWCNRIQCRNLM
ncbi:hypothetical protein Dimus_005597 [Dionaea muscipula]